jgi:hypothetical protein
MFRPLKFLLVTALLIAGWENVALAGSNSAKISCTSKRKDNNISLKGVIPASQSALDLTLTENSNKIRINEGGKIYLTEALGKGVFTMIVMWGEDAESGTIQLYAIPKTVKAQIGDGFARAKFDAIIDISMPNSLNPNPTAANSRLNGVKLSCSYDYEI